MLKQTKPAFPPGACSLVVFDALCAPGRPDQRAKFPSESRADAREVYQNVGIFVLRKYAGLLDLPFVFLTYLPRLFTSEPSSERALLVGTWRQYFTARAAFHSHASQLVWDRYLCVVKCLRDRD